MKAVGYRLLSQLRGRWAATLLLSLIAAVVCAVVITFAAGARRTTTVPARYAASVGGAFDAEVTQEEPGRPRTDEIRALPAVESADSYTFVFGGVVRPGADFPEDAISFTGLIEGLGAQLVSGRVPDPTAEGEFVASRSFMDAGDAQLGDQFTFRSFTQEQADASQFGNFEDAAGPSLPATLVGVIDSPEFIDQEGALLLFSPALLDRVDDGMGVSLSMTAIRLHDGSDTDELRTQLDSLPRSTGLSIGSGDYVSAEMHRAISTQGRGLWILAIVAGIAAVAVLGQLITRQVRLSLSERQQLTALGYTERQALIESLVRAGVPIVLGCLGARGWRSRAPGSSRPGSSVDSSRSRACSSCGRPSRHRLRWSPAGCCCGRWERWRSGERAGASAGRRRCSRRSPRGRPARRRLSVCTSRSPERGPSGARCAHRSWVSC